MIFVITKRLSCNTQKHTNKLKNKQHKYHKSTQPQPHCLYTDLSQQTTSDYKRKRYVGRLAPVSLNPEGFKSSIINNDAATFDTNEYWLQFSVQGLVCVQLTKNRCFIFHGNCVFLGKAACSGYRVFFITEILLFHEFVSHFFVFHFL